MKKLNQAAISLFISILALLVVLVSQGTPEASARPPLGVTNLDSIHLSDFNLTATPNFLANQRGTGAIAEFRDGGTPVARIPNGGGLNILVGGLTASGDFVLGTQSETVTATFTITPTAPLILISSNAAYTSSTTTAIATTGMTDGQVIVIRNDNASNVLTIDGTGGTVECKADIVLGADDTVTLIYNSGDSEWNCQSSYDNS